ncbi:hypothetical protein ABQE62_05640 [Mycolicibacterium fortuitum]
MENDVPDQDSRATPRGIPNRAVAGLWIAPIFWFAFQILVLGKSTAEAAFSPFMLLVPAAVALTAVKVIALKKA